jgi:hypothetical protein
LDRSTQLSVPVVITFPRSAHFGRRPGGVAVSVSWRHRRKVGFAILFTLRQVLTARVTGNAVLAALVAVAQLVSLR